MIFKPYSTLYLTHIARNIRRCQPPSIFSSDRHQFGNILGGPHRETARGYTVDLQALSPSKRIGLFRPPLGLSMKVRSDEQLLLALNAPERPERGAEGGKRWQQLQTTWVA